MKLEHGTWVHNADACMIPKRCSIGARNLTLLAISTSTLDETLSSSQLLYEDGVLMGGTETSYSLSTPGVGNAGATLLLPSAHMVASSATLTSTTISGSSLLNGLSPTTTSASALTGETSAPSLMSTQTHLFSVGQVRRPKFRSAWWVSSLVNPVFSGGVAFDVCRAFHLSGSRWLCSNRYLDYSRPVITL